MVSQVRLQRAARLYMWDVSTSHMTKKDAAIMAACPDNSLPRTHPHDYGGLVFVDSDPDAIKAASIELTKRGMSEEFVSLYIHACRDRLCMLLNFDRDGQVLAGIPVFDR